MISIVLNVFCFCVIATNAFNLAPKPNIALKEPNLKTFIPKNQSSYFGLSLNLRKSSIYIGAPRAQSNLPGQKNVVEPGAIYKCSVKTGICAPFVFDPNGNVDAPANDYTFDSEKKDHQWLGAALDGGSNDNDELVVCAPRLIAPTKDDYLMHGICYVALNTTGDQPSGLRRISPLRLKSDQTRTINNRVYLYYSYGELGFSVHITEDKKEIIFGAPGVAMWQGSMAVYRAKRKEDVGGQSRRDIHGREAKRAIPYDIEYESVVLQPNLWGQHNDSYFGYSLSSGFFEGPNSTKLLYIATAPQSNHKNGEAYLFSVLSTRYHSSGIKKYFTFEGLQFGEHFGYAVIAEDVNGDNYTDVIISAPQYYFGLNVDNGAIYVFINRGGFFFSDPIKYTSGRTIRERFGTTLSKLGDINQDGYNDIAVGAPFSGNGAVYIFLGGPNGLRNKPSQVIQSPTPFAVNNQSMFGHGLSKGVDIDFNGYNDLAIGEPNADSTYIYKSYPVVKIIAKVDSPSREVKIDQKKIQIRACWQLEGKSKKVTTQEVTFRLRADPRMKRVKLETNEVSFKAVASSTNQCKIYDATVQFSLDDIFKPIEIEMSYELTNKIPDSSVFCETCAVVDPDDPKIVLQKIAFMTGCKSDICVADLKIKSEGIISSFQFGSSDFIKAKYVIRNDGETAYLSQINITSSNKMPFVRIPPSCILYGVAILRCNLFDGRPMYKNDQTSIVIMFDSSNLQGTKLTLLATAFSSGKELNAIDNSVESVITLEEYSEIEQVGRPLTPKISLEDGLGIKKISNLLEIHNHGPSLIKQMKVSLFFPLSYIIRSTQTDLELINFNNITIKVRHNHRTLDITYMQNGTILIQNPTEKLTKSSNRTTASMRSPKNLASVSLSDKQYAEIANSHVDPELAKGMSGTLPINRTVFFNCNENNDVRCVEAVFTVLNLQQNHVVNITYSYSLDLDVVNKILIAEKDFFLVTTIIDASRIGDSSGSTLKVRGSYPNNIISKHHIYSTPIWVYIVSVVGGLLILLGMTYGMHKLGFFKREKMDELQVAKQSAMSDTEDEN